MTTAERAILRAARAWVAADDKDEAEWRLWMNGKQSAAQKQKVNRASAREEKARQALHRAVKAERRADQKRQP